MIVSYSQSQNPQVEFASHSNYDSLYNRFSKLYIEEINEANKFADSLLNSAIEEDWDEGMVLAKCMLVRVSSRNGAYDSAKMLATQVIDWIKDNQSTISNAFKVGFSYQHAMMHHQISSVEWSKGNYSLALDNANKCDSLLLHYFEGTEEENAQNFKKSRLLAKTIKGQVFYMLDDIESSIRIFEETTGLYKELGNMNNVAIGYMNLSTLYREAGDNVNALKAIQLAEEVATEINYTRMINASKTAYSQLYYSLKKYDDALGYAIEAKMGYENENERPKLALTLSDIGDCYKNLNQPDSSAFYYQEALALNKELNNMDDVAYVLSRLANLKKELEGCYEAQTYIQQGMKIAQELDLPYEKMLFNIIRAECLLSQGKLGEADRIVTGLLKTAASIDNTSHQREIYALAHKAAQQKGEFRKAYEHLSNYLMLNDSIYSEQKILELAKVQLEYEIEKETNELRAEQALQQAIFKKEVEEKKWMLMWAALLIIVLCFSAFLGWRGYQIKKKSVIQLKDKNRQIVSLAEREKELLTESVSLKEREIASMAMAAHEKNSLLNKLEHEISDMQHYIQEDHKTHIKKIKKTIANGYSMDNSWNHFQDRFELVHPSFMQRFKEENPELSMEELKLAAYLKVGMSNKEIANILNITHGSVKVKVNRLKRKLSMGPSDDLRNYMLNYN